MNAIQLSFIGFSDEVVLCGFIQMRCSCSDNCFFDLTLVDYNIINKSV